MKPYQHWTELELFEAVGKSDEGAFRDLKARIERIGKARSWRIGQTDLDDVVGRVLSKLEELRQRGFSGNNPAFRTYLYKVVASQLVEVWKEKVRLVSLDQPVELPGGDTRSLHDHLADMMESNWDALKEQEAREERDLFRKTWACLDERCRRLLWLKEVERRPEREIAKLLTMTVANVWASLHRCKEKLYRLGLAVLQTATDQAWQAKIAGLARKLVEPLATVFVLWWDEKCTIREIARRLGRDEIEVKKLLARAKATVWQLAQEAGDS